MTCKDCIHYSICDIPIITDGRKNAENCGKYKNKDDYAEVKHGEWIDRDGKTWCRLCGKSNKQYKPPYCPHCGAKMDGKE